MIDVLFIVLPDTLLLDLAGPAEVFRLANQQAKSQGLPPPFRMRYVGPQASVTSSVGLGLAPIDPLPDALDTTSWIILMGRPGDAATVTVRKRWWLTTRDWLSRQLAATLTMPTKPVPGASAAPTSPPHHRLVTVCVGALLAADAGLLRGRRVTTHHELVDALAAIDPSAQVVQNKVFVEDGPVCTSAGITTGIDLALHLTAGVCGAMVAQSVARVMVAYTRRGGDEPQHSPLLRWRDHLHPALHRVQDAIAADPTRAWGLHAMAETAHLTPRHLTRLFAQSLDVTPRRYVEQLRLALAQHALDQGASRQAAAQVAGFSGARQLATALSRRGPDPESCA
jgi:transcriptional regulator GlxA family with amidase domain